MLSNTRMLGANSRQLHAVGNGLAVSSLHNAVGVAHSPAPRLPLAGEATRFAHRGLTDGNARRFSPAAFTRTTVNLKGVRSCWGGYRGLWVYIIAPRAGRFAFSALT